MTSVYRESDLDQIVDGMIANMKFQIENPALLNSRFVFDEVLYLDVNFHQLNLMRGSSYLPLPDFIAKRKAVINSMFTLYRIGFCSVSKVAPVQCEQELIFCCSAEIVLKRS